MRLHWLVFSALGCLLLPFSAMAEVPPKDKPEAPKFVDTIKGPTPIPVRPAEEKAKEPEDALSKGDLLVQKALEPALGDLDKMTERGFVRALVPFSLSAFYIDKGEERGLQADLLREFEKRLNKGVKKEADKTRVLIIPTHPDELFDRLIAGQGDVIVAGLTVTEEREEDVDFADPIIKDVREVIATQPNVADIKSIEDLEGMQIFVRRESSFYPSLLKVNVELAEMGLEPVTIMLADDKLEEEDLYEMIDVGMIPAMVIDEHVGKFWSVVFKNVKLHHDLAIREGASIAWAVRQNSPQLEEEINEYMELSDPKTSILARNILARHENLALRLANPEALKYRSLLTKLEGLFQKYGEKYDIDPMLLAAQAFQESRFKHKSRSHAGAIGIMQLLPSTAADKSVNIKNFRTLEGNIEAGAKYLRWVVDNYFNDDEIPDVEKIYMALAAYNAGPNRVARVRKKAENPNLWFDNVEWEVAKVAGFEPIQYVKNIYRYYLAFNQILNRPHKLARIDQISALSSSD
ncbi:transporter substrate-binding domain-containing protein [Rhodobacteraceae bacterium RKSG542]|uniref:transglycosylase SLT domain-containing protein n=1 Tax=Pseudovibrio flavus TaxID=2529854 RepID=UPI0012BBFABD|nr:transglycosylase SLT domain-containing protein [Pseudovibrio flavus]MTI19057.1 transporter substrate-binding domain-containing protein [Pseudovibrio flavus]